MKKLEKVLEESSENISVILLTLPNCKDGHPVSMENIISVKKICESNGKMLFFDGSRFAENAYLIKTRERAYKDKTLSQIVKEMFSYSDGKCVKNYYYYKG